MQAGLSCGQTVLSTMGVEDGRGTGEPAGGDGRLTAETAGLTAVNADKRSGPMAAAPPRASPIEVLSWPPTDVRGSRFCSPVWSFPRLGGCFRWGDIRLSACVTSDDPVGRGVAGHVESGDGSLPRPKIGARFTFRVPLFKACPEVCVDRRRSRIGEIAQYSSAGSPWI